MATFKTDLKRPVETVTDFNPLLNERVINLPDTDIEDLKEVYLTLYGGSTVQPTGASRLLGGVEALEISINGRDMTPHVKKLLKRYLSNLPAAAMVQQYRASAIAWLDHVHNAGLAWPEFDRDRRRAQGLTAAEIIDAFDKLGDRTFGWSGQIHPFNFLYTGIGVPRLSFADLFISATGKIDAFVEDVRAKQSLRVVLREPNIARAGGRVTANFEMIYTSPLAELLEQALQALDQANRSIEDQRVNYLLPLRDEINRIKADLPLSIANVGSSIDRIDATIRDLVDGRRT